MKKNIRSSSITFIAVLMVILMPLSISCQTKTISPNEVLRACSKKLNSINTLKYNHSRELSYPANVYHDISSWDVYYNFDTNIRLTGFRYQVDNPVTKSVFNGTEQFDLDKKAKTIKVNQNPTRKSFKSLSFLYNSILTIKNALPLLIDDQSAIKAVNDTIIDGISHWVVDINIGKRRIQNLGDELEIMETDYDFRYRIFINKTDYLPYAILQTFNGENFIKTTFAEIEINNYKPDETSWFYSTYTDEYAQYQLGERPQLLQLGSPAPTWELESIDGNKISLDSFKGEIILLEFWIKNCGACIAAVSKLNELHKKFRDDKFNLISINIYDSKEDITLLSENKNIEYDVLMNGSTVANKYGVYSYPTIFIVDKNGKVAYSGSLKVPEIENILKMQLNKTNRQ